MTRYPIVSELSCGHIALTQTVPAKGAWITCPSSICQGQRQVTLPDVWGVLF